MSNLFATPGQQLETKASETIRARILCSALLCAALLHPTSISPAGLVATYHSLSGKLRCWIDTQAARSTRREQTGAKNAQESCGKWSFKSEPHRILHHHHHCHCHHLPRSLSPTRPSTVWSLPRHATRPTSSNPTLTLPPAIRIHRQQLINGLRTLHMITTAVILTTGILDSRQPTHLIHSASEPYRPFQTLSILPRPVARSIPPLLPSTQEPDH